MNIEKIAKTCHQVNKAICESMDDFSQKDWSEAADWQKQSAIKGVQFTIDNPNATAEDQHNAWVADKLKNGWIYGEIKDETLKTHHCLVPFNDLPQHQKAKDMAFKAVVKALCS